MKAYARASFSALLATLVATAGVPAGLAQTAGTPPSQGAAPAAGGSGMPMAGGMMGGQGGMMCGGMMGGMGQGGMEGRSGMMGMMDPSGGMMGRHVEGRLAFLKAELKITDAQKPAWDRFAAAMRASAKSMSEARQRMSQAGTPATPPERLDQDEKRLAARLDTLKSLKSAVDPLYASFNDEQKKTADELMIRLMGMM